MKRSIPIILLITSVIISCTRHSEVSDTLARAEAVMEEHPDSALSILEAIPDSALATDRDRALHALFLTQAHYKNRKDISSDTLIDIAVDYYSGKNNRYEMLAIFHKSLVSYYAGDYRTSTLNALLAKNLAEHLADTLFIARTNEHLADLYFLNYDLANDINFRKVAIESYKKCDKYLNALYAEIDMSISLTKKAEYQNALDVLDNIDITNHIKDTTVMRYFYNSYIPPLIKLGNNEIALERANQLICYVGNKQSLNESELCNITKAYLVNNCYDTGRKYINHILKNDSTATSRIKFQEIMLNLYLSEDNKDKAIELYESLLNSQNRIVESTFMTRIMEVEKDYYNKLSVESNTKLNRLHYWIIISVIVIILLITSVVFITIIYHIKSANIKLKIDNSMETLRQMETSIWNKELELEKVNKGLKESQRSVYDLFHKNFNIIDQLSNFYEDGSYDPHKAKLLYKKINRLISQFCDPKMIDEMESAANKYQNNIMSRFRTVLPELPSYLNRLALYTFLGFSPSSIAVFLQTSKSNVYTYRSKLKKILNDSTKEIPIDILQYFKIDSPIDGNSIG